jgi:hypothetical protein
MHEAINLYFYYSLITISSFLGADIIVVNEGG